MANTSRGKLKAVLGRNVRKYRLKARWTQEELSHRCGFARSYIGRIERGEFSSGVDMIEIIADVLKVRADQLLREDIRRIKMPGVARRAG